MYNELHLYGIGGFNISNRYFPSSEYDATVAWARLFDASGYIGVNKSSPLYIRACRAFTSITNYNLRDIGPAGGWIFWKSGNNYLEVTPSDQSTSKIWSNINLLVGTGTAIGTGQANTNAIIGQAGHIDSAAKLCDDLDTLYSHITSAAKLCDDLSI